jgi:hypothetical protein
VGFGGKVQRKETTRKTEAYMREWIVGRLAGVCGVELVVSGQKPVAGSCEHGDEPSGSGATELVTYSPSYTDFPQHPSA